MNNVIIIYCFNFNYLNCLSYDSHGNNMCRKKQKKTKRGPKPERVKIDRPWKDAVKDALEKKRPKDGWPDEKK